MKDLTISIALCTYNGARFLREQLDSIAAQTKLPAELVICDDRSRDETLSILKSFAQHAPFPVRIDLNETNIGSTRNFEKAIRVCDKEIIALSDQDDIWEPRKLEVIARVFDERSEIGYVFSDAQLIDRDGHATGRTLWESVAFTGAVFQQFTLGSQVAALLRSSIITGATMAFRSSLRTTIVPFSPYFVHDSWISVVASCIGAQGVPIPDRLVRYREHGAQQIGTRRKSIIERIAFLRESGNDEWDRALLGTVDLRERLLSATAQGVLSDASTLRLVEEKVEHCSRRKGAHREKGLTRARKVLFEVLTGRYARFSNSWRSVLADLYF